MINLESQSQASYQLSVSHSITSLRFLNSTDWKIFVESLSAVENALQNDPARIYSLMDFATRDNYRHVVESVAHRSTFSEVEVAEQAILLAEDAYNKGLPEREYHVGYYLVGDGLNLLIKKTECKRPFKSKIRHLLNRFPLSFYGWAITLLTLAGTFMFMYFIHSPEVPYYDWRVILL